MQQGEFNHISSSKGVLPVWQAEAVVNYDPNLLPVEAVALQDEVCPAFNSINRFIW